MSTRTASKTMAGPLDLSVDEYLARLKKDRRRTMAALNRRRWRLTSAPVKLDAVWRLVDETVRDDGSVDFSVLSPDTSTPADADPAARTAGPIPLASFGPAMVDAAVKVVALCMAAFTAGYAVGKEVGEALDDDAGDESGEGGGAGGEGEGDGGNGGGDGAHAERSRIILEPRDKGRISVRVGAIQATTRAVPLDEMTVEEFLARLKTDRQNVVRDLSRNRNWRIVSGPVGSGPMATVVDTAVRPDGSLDLAAFDGQPPADVQTMGPLGTAIAVVAGAVVASFVVGAIVGFAVETLGDDENPDEGEGDGEQGGDGGGDSGGGGSGASTGRTVVGTVQPGRDDEVVLAVHSAT